MRMSVVKLVSTDEIQSHVPAPFSSTGLISTLPQLAFNKVVIDASSTQGSGQRLCQMISKTEQCSIQVPLDVQSASKVVNEKPKRNALASTRFRQRRREHDQKTSNTISSLEAEVRKLTGEKEQYRLE